MIPKSLLVGALTLALVPVVGMSPAYACSCVKANEKQQFERAGAVFKGTVAERTVPAGQHHDASAGVVYTFTVSTVYKGTVASTQAVRTASQSAACGVSLSGAGPFLVFASPAGRTPDAGLSMNLCGGTRKIAADAEPSFGPGKPVDQDPGGGGAAADPSPAEPGLGRPPAPSDEDHGQDAPGLVPGLLGPLMPPGLLGSAGSAAWA